MTSIWLLPEESQQGFLQRLVKREADENRTVAFEPHLTVCGVPGDLAVLDNVAAYILETGLLPLRVTKQAVTGAVITPFRAVFIEIENTPQLREFREGLRAICGAPAFDPPHISLLYTLDRDSQTPRPDLDARALAVTAARCAAAIQDTHFTLARAVVNSSGSGDTDVRSWRTIRHF